MTARRIEVPPDPVDRRGSDAAFASNEVRLSVGNWGLVLLLVASVFWSIPIAWERFEPLESGQDYRVPFPLSHDYWTVHRYARRVAEEDKTIVLGDSVVWGHYVSRRQTLSHYLNEFKGADRYVNFGIDGIHPVAMQGLVEHYLPEITDKNVILHCNLLWISSERHDLSTDKESTFNHPELVPQFHPRVPCYHESLSRRLGIAIGRHVPFFGWVDHLQIAYFQDTDLASWTIEHPYANPAGRVTLHLPSPDEPPSPRPVAEPWTAKGLRQFNPDWVELERSLQWRCFRGTIDMLQRRGNAVLVFVGPFNEHMLGPESLAVYRTRKAGVASWLRERGIPHCVVDPLPSDHYADASHPLDAGYRELARRLLEHAATTAEGGFFAE